MYWRDGRVTVRLNANTLSHSPDPTGAAFGYKHLIGTGRASGPVVTFAQELLVLQE